MIGLPPTQLPPIQIGGIIVQIPGMRGFILDLARARIREAIIAQILDAIDGLEAVAETRCTGDQRRALEATADGTKAALVQAQQRLKLLTDPNPKQFAYQLEQRRQAIVLAESRVQKLKTGGSRDLRTLELNVARARAEVESVEASLAGDQPALHRAQLRGAQAALADAEYRIEQARSGQGGVDARAEDITMAAADLAARQAELRQATDPQSETVQIARSAVDVADAAVQNARSTRDACDRPDSISTTRINGEKSPEKAFTAQSCSDDLEDALDGVVEKAQADRSVARAALRELVNPSEQTIRNVAGPRRLAVAAAEARLQKLKSGGSSDQATLDLNAAVARADVDFWQAGLDGSPRSQVEAQLRAARAVLREAEHRQEQARLGKGGVDARPEDIAIAEGELETARLKLLELTDPTPEAILKAQGSVDRATAIVQEARMLRKGCDDPRSITVKKEDEDDPDPPERTVAHIQCQGGLVDAKMANVDEAEANLVGAQSDLKKLVNPAEPEWSYTWQPYQLAVDAAELRVQKLRTGASRDAATLELNVALARTEIDRLQGILDGNREAELRARLAGAEAMLNEATFRVTQAQSGQGGADARAEDIQIAQGALESEVADLQALVVKQPEFTQKLQSGIDAAAAGARSARGSLDACGRIKTISVTTVNGREENTRTVTDPNCSDDMRSALRNTVDIADLQHEIAQQNYNLYHAAASPQNLYIATPDVKAVEVAKARLQKVMTGGSRDMQTLELNVALAQTQVDRWRAELAGVLPDAARARLAAAQVQANEAVARREQAASGQGGAHARSEDITIAEADLVSRQNDLALELDYFQEFVQMVRLSVSVADLSIKNASLFAKACDEIRMTSTFQDNDNHGSDDNDDQDVKIKTRVRCPDDTQDGVEAISDALKGARLVLASQLSYYTEVDTNQKHLVVAIGPTAAVTRAEAELAKLKTGGPDDSTRLDLDVASAQAQVECREAVVNEVVQNLPTGQQPPYAWADPNICDLDQLPGKLPPFTQSDVRAPR